VDELWLPVVGCEKWYEISSFGRVRRIAAHSATTIGRVRRFQQVLPNGYAVMILDIGGKKVNKYIHDMVARAFLGAPANGMEVNHKDRCRTNNAVANLEWCSHLENVRRSSVPKLKTYEVASIKYLLSLRRFSEVRIAKCFNVCPATVYAIRVGITWKDISPKKHTCSLTSL